MSIFPASSYYIFKHKHFNHIALGMLLLLTLYCLSSSFSRGMANAWYYNAEFSLNVWAKNNIINDKAEYTSTLTSIKKAQYLDPTHPHYAHMTGRIMHWGVDMGFEDTTKLPKINQWYLLATKLRPLWPDPWVDLLRLNNSLYGYNDKTKYYIDKVLNTGPYIELVTLTSLQVWLLNWEVLSGKEREMLFKQFEVVTRKYKTLRKYLSFQNK